MIEEKLPFRDGFSPKPNCEQWFKPHTEHPQQKGIYLGSNGASYLAFLLWDGESWFVRKDRAWKKLLPWAEFEWSTLLAIHPPCDSYATNHPDTTSDRT